jgi:hypothetical protein
MSISPIPKLVLLPLDTRRFQPVKKSEPRPAVAMNRAKVWFGHFGLSNVNESLSLLEKVGERTGKRTCKSEEQDKNAHSCAYDPHSLHYHSLDLLLRSGNARTTGKEEDRKF